MLAEPCLGLHSIGVQQKEIKLRPHPRHMPPTSAPDSPGSVYVCMYVYILDDSARQRRTSPQFMNNNQYYIYIMYNGEVLVNCFWRSLSVTKAGLDKT